MLSSRKYRILFLHRQINKSFCASGVLSMKTTPVKVFSDCAVISFDILKESVVVNELK
jgi:hypothetical protein